VIPTVTYRANDADTACARSTHPVQHDLDPRDGSSAWYWYAETSACRTCGDAAVGRMDDGERALAASVGARVT